MTPRYGWLSTWWAPGLSTWTLGKMSCWLCVDWELHAGSSQTLLLPRTSMLSPLPWLSFQLKKNSYCGDVKVTHSEHLVIDIWTSCNTMIFVVVLWSLFWSLLQIVHTVEQTQKPGKRRYVLGGDNRRWVGEVKGCCHWHAPDPILFSQTCPSLFCSQT